MDGTEYETQSLINASKCTLPLSYYILSANFIKMYFLGSWLGKSKTKQNLLIH